jgi:hypothetical protein
MATASISATIFALLAVAAWRKLPGKVAGQNIPSRRRIPNAD